MILALLAVAGGLLLLYIGAEVLVRGSSSLALRMGLTPLVIGLTVVAFGTSSPELAVSVQSTLTGRDAIAVGNVVGSNICNIALILGLSALVRPLRVQAQILRLDVPLMIIASVLLLVLLTDGVLTRVDGLFLTLGIIAYTTFNLWNARRQAPRLAEAAPRTSGVPWRDLLFIVGGLGLLVGGAYLLVDGATFIAQTFGLSEAVIGLTIVAIGTSLPELATSAVATYRGEVDIAVGNVIGSNVFNILAILGLSALAHPLTVAGIGVIDLSVMMGIALLMIPLLWTGFQLVRWEGAFLLMLYAGYVWWLLP